MCIRSVFLIWMVANAVKADGLTDYDGPCKVDISKKYIKHGCNDSHAVIRCNGTGITQVPKQYPPINGTLCLLDLSDNKIEMLKSGDFAYNPNIADMKILYLENNSISRIQNGSLEGLNKLVYLNLYNNSLINVENIENDSFVKLPSLEKINLKENNLKSFVGLGKKLQDIPLRKLLISPCNGCHFGTDFRNISGLKTLCLSGRTTSSCLYPTVTNYTFSYVSQIEHLRLSQCNINEIEADAFSNLTNLRYLDISYNQNLGFLGMNKGLYGLRNSSVEVLNAKALHEMWERGTILKVEHIENLQTLHKLKRLHMDLNKLEVFEEGVLNPYRFPISLKTLTLAGNRLTYGKYTNYLHNGNVKHVDISGQHLNYDPFLQEHNEPEDDSFLDFQHTEDSISANNRYSYSESLATDLSKGEQTNNQNSNLHEQADLNIDNGIEYYNVNYAWKNITTPFKSGPIYCNCNGTTNQCLRIFLPRTITELLWRKSFLYFFVPDTILCGANNLKHLDLSFNLITKWRGRVFGLSSLEILDMSDNLCNEMPYNFFNHIKSLQFLNISGNRLGKVFQPRGDNITDNVFTNLKHLKVLDISNNKLLRLSKDFFMDLNALEVLNLSSNIIDNWNTSLSNSPCLRFLDLSSNKLDTLPKYLLEDLELKVDNKCNKGFNIVVDMEANPIDCTCRNLPFLRNLNTSRVYFLFANSDQCHLKSGERVQLNKADVIPILVEELETECQETQTWPTITAVVIASSVTSVIICFVIHRYRWKLRYIYYSRNKRYRHEGFERLFEYDAFISYTQDNASFIKTTLVPELEGRYGLKVWVADRNATPGASVAENITHAIYNSKKALLLIDRKYCKESWCDYEMNMAHTESVETNRSMLIIVIMEKFPFKSLPINVMRMLRTEKSIEYPEHPQDLDTFWATVADNILTE